jgi:hypothetical protein
MLSIMKKRFTVSSTTVCLTHSLPSTSNRSTSASLTRNPSRWPWRALQRPPARNRCHKSSHPVPLLLIPKLLQAIRRRLQRIRRRRSSRPHVLARRRWHAVWAFHVHEGVAKAAPRRPSVGRLGGVTVVDLLGGVTPWVLPVLTSQARAAKQCLARPLVCPEGPSLVTGPAPLPRLVLLDIVDLHQR